MFGKSKPPGAESVLASRLRNIAARAPAGAVEKMPPRSQDRAARQAVFRNATLTLDSGERMTVAVKDVSATGARVEFFRHVPLPQNFMLSEPMMKLKRRVRVVWQREGVAGVEFVD
ncbi:MAG: hypothetical protein DCF16_19325 [Alphaproteobacteria bacterium]|nr:MAG: hypothetical protein DCF16_19325 [Alphaproteobacteria bacterium]